MFVTARGPSFPLPAMTSLDSVYSDTSDSFELQPRSQDFVNKTSTTQFKPDLKTLLNPQTVGTDGLIQVCGGRKELDFRSRRKILLHIGRRSHIILQAVVGNPYLVEASSDNPTQKGHSSCMIKFQRLPGS